MLDDTAGCALVFDASAFETWLAARSPQPPSVIASDDTMINAFIPNVSLLAETGCFAGVVELVTFSSFMFAFKGLPAARIRSGKSGQG